MSEIRIGRRQLVRTAAGVAAGGALAVGSGVGAASADSSNHHDDEGRGLLGSWWVKHTNDAPADPEPGIAVVGFASGGVITSNDVQPPGPLGTGAWTRDGDRFRATFWAGQPGQAPDDPGLSIRIKVRGRLRRGKISGTFTLTGYAPDQTVLFTTPGHFTGTRMTA